MPILSKFAGKVNQGEVQGVGRRIGSLVNIIGLIICEPLYNSIGSHTFFTAAKIRLVVFASSFN